MDPRVVGNPIIRKLLACIWGWHAFRSQSYYSVWEVRKMANKHTYQSYCLVKRFSRSGWYASVVGSLMIPAIAMAATPSANQAVVKQLALNAYCSEAHSKSTSMANGST
jgi:hypothetical protein